MTQPKKETVVIPFTKMKREFKRHFEMTDNYKIMLSGAFGSGKTTFLAEYFNDNSDYETVKLCPVNYSIALNEDILELVKFDILFELLAKKGVKFDSEEFSKWLTGQMFVQDHAYDILKPFIENAGKLGKNIVSIINPLINLYKKYQLHHKDVQINEEKDVLDYLNSFKRRKGNIREEDHLTNIITKALASLKKKTVLIIDDLDRIDPEHIFRILNVFSAQIDHYTNENKFQFDKIILVADIVNVREIYRARYGSSVDFSGYIDKFYSKTIFKYNLSQDVANYVREFLCLFYFESKTRNILIQQTPNINDLLVELIRELIINKQINLRKLKQLEGLQYSIINDDPRTRDDFYINLRYYPIVGVIKFLLEIFDSVESLKLAFESLRKSSLTLDQKQTWYLPFIVPAIHIEDTQSGEEREYILRFGQHYDDALHYTLKRTFDGPYTAAITKGALEILTSLELLVDKLRTLRVI